MLAFALKNYQAVIGLVATVVLGTLLGIQKIETRHWHKQSDQFETLYHGEQQAHATTVANYRRAADEARAKDAENAKRVLSEQAAINKEHSDELEARLADARARYDRLRATGPASANPSGPGVAPVSPVPNASGQPDQAALEDQLLATEQALQLDELIKWVKRQTSVEVSK